MNQLQLTVNGEAARLAEGATVADVVRVVTEQQNPRGVAVAVDRCVIPRSEWASTKLQPGSQVEVVSAAAGG